MNTIFFITQIFLVFQALSQCSADDPCLKVKMTSLLEMEASDSGGVLQQGGKPSRRESPATTGT